MLQQHRLTLPKLTTKLSYLQVGDGFFSLKRHASSALAELYQAYLKGAQYLYSYHCFNQDHLNIKDFFQKYQKVDSSPLAKKELLKKFYQHHFTTLEHFPTIGITGTNGKTSCAHLLSQALACSAEKWACLGTLGLSFPKNPFLKKETLACENLTWNLTTPDLIDHYWVKAYLIEKKYHGLICEVSSHALVQKRVYGVKFLAVLATSMTLDDHLDYHKTPSKYLQAKALLFNDYHSDLKVIQLDNPLVSLIKDKKTLRVLPGSTNFLEFCACGHKEDILREKFFLEFHRENLNLVCTTMRYLRKTPLTPCINSLIHPSLKGRGDVFFWPKNRVVIVDYAHTPNALAYIGRCLRSIFINQKITVLFGCGGDRDKSKRAPMYQQVALYAHRIVISEDNNRSEKFEDIAQSMLIGASIEQLSRTFIMANRVLAINKLYELVASNSVILIAGKGPELYSGMGHDEKNNTDLKQVQSYV